MDEKFSVYMDKNIELVKNALNDDSSVLYRSFKNRSQGLKLTAVFVESMVSKDIINKDILLPLINTELPASHLEDEICSYIIDEVLITCETKSTDSMEEMLTAVLGGDTAVFVEGCSKAIIIGSKGFEVRAIAEPETEKVVLGPREGFNESLNTNISLIRRRLKHKDLKFVSREVGSYSKTSICICYIESIADPAILVDLNKRLDKLQIDAVLDSAYIKELINDAPNSIMPTIGETERPDIVAGKLLEGRIALLCDGSPFALTLPYVFIETIQANEDYYNNYFYASINRLLRWLAFFLTTSVPAIYLSVITYHQEIVPTKLLLSISSARQGVPFPTVLEAFLMLITFEILREAGIRLPKPIGQTVSIVGALVLGQAAVEAKFISAPMVIITAITGIAVFMIPKLIGPALVLRYILLILASVLGLYGYMFGVIGISLYMHSIRSFGIPYTLKLGSSNMEDMKDTYIRANLRSMDERPNLFTRNLRRGKL